MIELIAEKFKDIVEIVGFDLLIVSKIRQIEQQKVYVKEISKGLNTEKKRKVAVFENTYGCHLL